MTLASVTAPCRISDFEIVESLLKLICAKRLRAQDKFSISIDFRSPSSLREIKAFAVATATILLTASPFFHKTIRNFYTRSWTTLNISGCPNFYFIILVMLLFVLKTLRYLRRRFRTILSLDLRWGRNFINFLIAAAAPLIAAYLPIRYVCFSIFWVGPFFLTFLNNFFPIGKRTGLIFWN